MGQCVPQRCVYFTIQVEVALRWNIPLVTSKVNCADLNICCWSPIIHDIHGKKIMFKTVSVFHKLTLKLPYNPIIFKNRIFFTISDFVDIILIFFRIQRTIWWWNFFGSPINFLHFRKNAWNCTIFKTQYLIKYSKYTEKNFTIVFVFSIRKQWV